MAIYVTSEGKRMLEEELRYLKTDKMKDVVETMETAISMGDLHEYAEAKEHMEKIKAHIAELEDVLKKIVVKDTV